MSEPPSTPDRGASGRALSRCIGLVGGLGPPATVHYYNALLAALARRDLVPQLVIVHAELDRVLGLVAANDTAGLADYLAALIRSLAQAGAAFAVVPAVTPHICAPELTVLSPLPLVDIIDALIGELDARGVRRAALLGTRFTMERCMFGRLDRFEIIDIGGDTRAEVHRIYTSIAANGGATSADLTYLKDLCRALHAGGADAIVAAGTELSVVLHEGEDDFPLVDCAKAHVAAIVERAAP